MATKKREVEADFVDSDDYPPELRAAVNRYPCYICQVSQLLACGVPVSDIIAALKMENPE